MNKRLFDLFFSLLLILLSLPIFFGVAAFIAACDGLPIFFTQTRAGKDEKPFTVLKFRTFRKGAPNNLTASERHDRSEYLISGGGILRKYGLDELPQLFCVLSGTMSLVGPRPLIPKDVETLRLRRENGADKLLPGITGYAQIHGRNELSPKEKADLDGFYAAHRSAALDLRILLQTVPCLLFPARNSSDTARKRRVLHEPRTKNQLPSE